MNPPPTHHPSQENRIAAGLAQGVATMGLAVSLPQQVKLLDYLRLLQKWNRVHNLTAVREPEAMLTHHLLDALSVLPHVTGITRLADVGTGGGIPGIVLAISLPALEVTLIESNQKKVSFLRQAVMELGLTNVHVENCRVEDYVPESLFDAVISRAFSELALFAALSTHLLKPGGELLAMKGRTPQEEIAALPENIAVGSEHTLSVPGLEGERCLIRMRIKT